MFIHILETDDPFDWTPRREDGPEPYTSVFHLRPVPNAVKDEIKKRHSRHVWDDAQRQMLDTMDDETAYAEALIDYAIVDWTGIKAATTGADLPCTPAMKAKLPDQWKVEILRMCSGRVAGDVVPQAVQEKKRSKSISSSKPTPAVTSSAA